eukprot:gene57377-biopygen84985
MPWKRDAGRDEEAAFCFPCCFLCSHSLAAGCTVTVVGGFLSGNATRVLLAAGQRGTVRRIDADGDAQVDFADHDRLQWVKRADFGRLAVNPVVDEEGGEEEEEDEDMATHTLDPPPPYLGVLEGKVYHR